MTNIASFKFFKYWKKVPSIGLGLNVVLFVLLVVAAYFVGSMKTEIAYLKKNNAAVSAQISQAAKVQGASNTAPDSKGPVAEVSQKDHIKGNRDAKVKIIEYSDFECPFCKSFHPTMQQILKDYGDNVAWVLRHYPLSFHANAQKEAEAAECVGELGGDENFWAFTDKIFERTTSNGTGFALTKLGPLALEVGVDQVQFQQCLDSGKYAQFVKDSISEGQSAGVSGTPTSFVVFDGTNKLIAGALPIEQVKQAIDAALSK